MLRRGAQEKKTRKGKEYSDVVPSDCGGRIAVAGTSKERRRRGRVPERGTARHGRPRRPWRALLDALADAMDRSAEAMNAVLIEANPALGDPRADDKSRGTLREVAAAALAVGASRRRIGRARLVPDP